MERGVERERGRERERERKKKKVRGKRNFDSLKRQFLPPPLMTTTLASRKRARRRAARILSAISPYFSHLLIAERVPLASGRLNGG